MLLAMPNSKKDLEPLRKVLFKVFPPKKPFA